MESMIVVTCAVIVLLVGVAFCMHEALRQRPRARLYRAKFIEAADDLAGKHDFPDDHAEHLLVLASFRPGWVTRAMVLMLFKRVLFGGRVAKGRLKFDSIPSNLRPRFVTAMLSFALSDSYHSAVFGRIYRAVNPWMADAVRDVKPDVAAHATRRAIEQVDNVNAPRRRDEMFACA